MNLGEFRERLNTIRSNTNAATVLPAIFDLISTQWSQFDVDAQREANRIIDGLIRMGAEEGRRVLPTLSDGEQKRSLVRLISRGERDHLTALDLTKVLEGETKQTDPVVAHASKAFHDALQVCLDLLFEVRQRTSGKRGVVLSGLFHGLIDELLVGFHLAQRAFVPQAYAHVRTVEEALDFGELFASDPALMERWLSVSNEQDEAKVYRELRRAAKKKFGTGSTAKLYAFLSAVGSHPQFRNLQARAMLSKNTATFFILGSPRQIAAANVLVVRATVATAHTLARMFADHFHIDDVKALLTECTARLHELTKDYLIPAAQQMGISPDEAHEILEARTSDQRK